MPCKSPHNLASCYLWPHFLLFACHTLLLSLWPPFCAQNVVDILLPQNDFCTWNSFYLECSPPKMDISCSLTSFRSIPKRMFLSGPPPPPPPVLFKKKPLSLSSALLISPLLLHFSPVKLTLTRFILHLLFYFLSPMRTWISPPCFAKCLAHSWYTILSVWMLLKMHLYSLLHCLTGASVWACIPEEDEADWIETLFTHSRLWYLSL